MRGYRIHLIASKGRFFSAGEPIPDDVSTPGCAERYRIREDEQPDESDSRKSTAASERDDRKDGCTTLSFFRRAGPELAERCVQGIEAAFRGGRR
jgi:hypothetical protein